MKTQKIVLLTATLVLGLTLSGCSSLYTRDSQGHRHINDTAAGAGIGAVGGTLVGATVGGPQGALIGAGAGGVAGGVIGHGLQQ